MAKCPVCSARKGKRRCPALKTDICPQCCAEGRLVTISCPRSCEHLASELYQHERRKVRAFSRGRGFTEWTEKTFPAPAGRMFGYNLAADIYYFCRRNGAVRDEDLAAVLEHVAGERSPILVPGPGASHPLRGYLAERLADGARYPTSSSPGAPPALAAEEQTRALRAVARSVRELAAPRAGATPEPCRFVALIASFFDALDFEADLNYSPDDEDDDAAAPPPAPAGSAGSAGSTGPTEPRSAGGIILPP